jgi:hypothetical protein
VPHYAVAACIAGDFSVIPFEPDLGGEDDVLPEPIGESLANDFLRVTEAVDRRRVDGVDAVRKATA